MNVEQLVNCIIACFECISCNLETDDLQWSVDASESILNMRHTVQCCIMELQVV